MGTRKAKQSSHAACTSYTLPVELEIEMWVFCKPVTLKHDSCNCLTNLEAFQKLESSLPQPHRIRIALIETNKTTKNKTN